MFAKYNTSFFKSFAHLSSKNFSNFTPAQLSHIKVACTAKDSKNAPNLIALHGVLGSAMNFNQFANKPVISSQVNSYLVDVRNHGSSEHKESMSYPEMAKDVYRFIVDNKLEDKENILLGFSMGARVAMEVAVTYPELIKGVALVDLAPHDYINDSRFNVVEAMNTMLRNLCQIDLMNDRTQIKKDIMSVAFAGAAGEVMNSNVVPAIGGGYKWRLNLESIANNFLPQILNAKYTGYDTYSGPVKVILGGASEYTSRDILGSFHQMFENFDEERDVETVEGAGHWVHASHPNEFLKIIANYITELNRQ